MKKVKLKSQYFILMLAAYFTVILNYPFFRESWKVLEKLDAVKTGFIISLPFFVFFALTILFTLFAHKYISKPFFILLVVISSLVSYAAIAYGTVFDYGMIQNTVQTNISESSSYLNVSLIITFILTGVVPALLIARTEVVYHSFFKELLKKVGLVLGCTTGLFVIASMYYQDYASIGRNNKFLQKYIVPTQYVWSSYKYVKKTYFTTPLKFEQLGLDAKVTAPATETKPQLMVMVLGETARTMNYQYNGYSRATNPFTQKDGLISFKDVSTCGTATAISVPCMFSFMNRTNYDGERAVMQDNALDLIQRAGYNVQWIENDGGCKGVCARVPSQEIAINSSDPFCDDKFCYDAAMLPELKKRIAEAQGKNTIITLHLIGSHGPTYFRRYPDSHRIFTPDCERSDIQNCTQEELVNTYDNTIAYTDYILSQVIDILKQNESQYDTSMLYMSDHGESLGENGLYLHGTPYAIAPKEQTHVPALLWLSPQYAKQEGIDMNCLKEEAANKSISHDFLSHSLLGITNVKTNVYKPEYDFMANCQKVS